MDTDKPNHSYNTRSKNKRDKKSHKRNIDEIRKSKHSIETDMRKNAHHIIDSNIRDKITFQDSDNDSDYNPDEDAEYMAYLDELEKEDNLRIHLDLCDTNDDIDEHGNIKGLIDYDYIEDDVKTRKDDIRNAEMIYSILTKTLIKAIDGTDETDDRDNKAEGDVAKLKSKSTAEERYTKRNLYKAYSPLEREYYESLKPEERDRIFELEREITKSETRVPLRFRILDTPFPNDTKKKLLDKLQVLNHIDRGNSEYYKLKRWVDGLMKIPFGKYIEPPVSKDDDKSKITKYLTDAYTTLDDAVYGHDDAKTEIMLLISKWISNPSSHGNVIGIVGPPGNGKTTLVRRGVSRAIKKPFAFITLGGATDASFLEGHSYTYEGSIPGRIVDILGQHDVNCMNPIFYFDELDKISDTARGHEIHNILCHLTDFSQNDAFHDKYYAGIDFDLSKSLFIFSFNDIELVNPILRDRMTIIKTHGFDKNQKIELAQRFLLPEIYKDLGMDPSMIIFTENTLGYIITNFTNDEAGVRSLKRKLTTILSKLNVSLLLGDTKSISKRILSHSYNFPLQLTNNIVDQLLKTNEDNSKLTRIEMSMYM